MEDKTKRILSYISFFMCGFMLATALFMRNLTLNWIIVVIMALGLLVVYIVNKKKKESFTAEEEELLKKI